MVEIVVQKEHGQTGRSILSGRNRACHFADRRQIPKPLDKLKVTCLQLPVGLLAAKTQIFFRYFQKLGVFFVVQNVVAR
jgi:hypothetical protein